MTNPQNFMNGIGSIGYPFSIMPISYTQNILFNPMNNFQFSPFSNQMGYTYMMPQQRMFSQFPMYNITPMINTTPLENINRNHWNGQVTKNANIKQKLKTNEMKGHPQIIQISEEDFGLAQQKKSSEKNSTTIMKPIQKEQPITQKIIAQIKNKKQLLLSKSQQKNKTKKEKQLKGQKLIKVKQVVIKHKPIKKAEININQKVQPKARIIFSKRINQKLQNKHQPYKLTKKDKQLFQISFLRDTHKQIMTGPQFQAKIPPFILHKPTINQWKNKIKQNLLLRLYKQQEQSQ